MSDGSKKTISCNFGGFFALLAVGFILMKVGGVITWPWVWVLSPLWIPWLILLVVIIVVALGLWVYNWVDEAPVRKKRKENKSRLEEFKKKDTP